MNELSAEIFRLLDSVHSQIAQLVSHPYVCVCAAFCEKIFLMNEISCSNLFSRYRSRRSAICGRAPMSNFIIYNRQVASDLKHFY